MVKTMLHIWDCGIMLQGVESDIKGRAMANRVSLFGRRYVSSAKLEPSVFATLPC